MGIEVMRGNNARCPSYLVFGLITICALLVMNWWSLSSQNFELLRQVELLSEELRVSSSEVERLNNLNVVSQGRVRGYQEGAAQQRVRIEQLRATEEELRSAVQTKEDIIKSCKKESETAQNSNKLCSLELDSLKKLDISKDSTMATLRAEKSSLNKDLESQREEINKLKDELLKLKTASSVPIVKKLFDKLSVKSDKTAERVPEGNNEAIQPVDENGEEVKENNEAAGPLDADDQRENEMAPNEMGPNEVVPSLAPSPVIN